MCFYIVHIRVRKQTFNTNRVDRRIVLYNYQFRMIWNLYLKLKHKFQKRNSCWKYMWKNCISNVQMTLTCTTRTHVAEVDWVWVLEVNTGTTNHRTSQILRTSLWVPAVDQCQQRPFKMEGEAAQTYFWWCSEDRTTVSVTVKNCR